MISIQYFSCCEILMKTLKCSYCGFPIPASSSYCPHCARPSLYPNVNAANDIEEKEALEKRYHEAVLYAKSKNYYNLIDEFEKSIKRSKAVINRSILETDKIATNENQLYASFYKLIESGVRIPEDNKWDKIRDLTDDALFPGYKKDIIFACLCLDGSGLFNYGKVTMALKETMIAHRASVFEENSVKFMENHNIRIAQSHKLPKGYRASWENRHKLCVAKHFKDLNLHTDNKDFPRIILREGKTTAEDIFIEVHIWGTLSIRSFDHMKIKEPKRKQTRVILKALKKRLEKYGVSLEEVK